MFQNPKDSSAAGQVIHKSHLTLVRAIGEKCVKCQTLSAHVCKSSLRETSPVYSGFLQYKHKKECSSFITSQQDWLLFYCLTHK